MKNNKMSDSYYAPRTPRESRERRDSQAKKMLSWALGKGSDLRNSRSSFSRGSKNAAKILDKIKTPSFFQSKDNAQSKQKSGRLDQTTKRQDYSYEPSSEFTRDLDENTGYYAAVAPPDLTTTSDSPKKSVRIATSSPSLSMSNEMPKKSSKVSIVTPERSTPQEVDQIYKVEPALKAEPATEPIKEPEAKKEVEETDEIVPVSKAEDPKSPETSVSNESSDKVESSIKVEPTVEVDTQPKIIASVQSSSRADLSSIDVESSSTSVEPPNYNTEAAYRYNAAYRVPSPRKNKPTQTIELDAEIDQDLEVGLLAITKKEVLRAQRLWGDSIVKISQIYARNGDFVTAAGIAASKLYAYGHGNVLFKPTKATKNPFRPSAGDAMSYFVGADALEHDKYAGEDSGFAINGGRGWKHVEFRNHQIELVGTGALAMGEYFFTDALSDKVVRVEYSFGYKRCYDGKVRICLHHSSIPYTPPVTKSEVLAAQKQWADAIVNISEVYAKKGDFVKTAADAAGQLYAYGHCEVLFKPTKATKNPFRSTASGAMSYFVGAEAMNDDAYRGEDNGFAINGGRGWKHVEFDNYQIDYNGSTAQAMGSYKFTDAISGDVARVEYTFGYKRNEDGLVRIYLHHSSVPYTPPVTKAEVLVAQNMWADAIVRISNAYAKKEDFVKTATEAAGQLYSYGHCEVLFKPTKATKNPFRPTAAGAMSYFVGAEAMNDYDYRGEDAGFAINGGRGWSAVEFDNCQIDLNGPTAQAIGSYFFTDAKSGEVSRVEYTFGYKRNDDGVVRIYLHHSSVPYTPSLTKVEVLAAQKRWADAIVRISEVYANKGDYVKTATEAAGRLYAYGHCDVLFKPTKATKHPFRPTAEGAMSYFVGADAMENDKYRGEDAGFAINGGRGWSKVEFDNSVIDFNGPTAQAMGSYMFTDSKSGEVARVEFTFGYKRNSDGVVRIYLHHSSVPYAKH